MYLAMPYKATTVPSLLHLYTCMHSQAKPREGRASAPLHSSVVFCTYSRNAVAWSVVCHISIKYLTAYIPLLPRFTNPKSLLHLPYNFGYKENKFKLRTKTREDTIKVKHIHFNFLRFFCFMTTFDTSHAYTIIVSGNQENNLKRCLGFFFNVQRVFLKISKICFCNVLS